LCKTNHVELIAQAALLETARKSATLLALINDLWQSIIA